MPSLQSAVADAGFTKRGGGAKRPRASHVGLCGRGGANSGGGGGGGGSADASIGPRALETLGTPLMFMLRHVGYCSCFHVLVFVC